MKTIIEMAREAGLRRFGPLNIDPELERFATLVRADEREACAQLCEYEWGTLAEKEAGLMYAAAIRARGNT